MEYYKLCRKTPELMYKIVQLENTGLSFYLSRCEIDDVFKVYAMHGGEYAEKYYTDELCEKEDATYEEEGFYYKREYRKGIIELRRSSIIHLEDGIDLDIKKAAPMLGAGMELCLPIQSWEIL